MRNSSSWILTCSGRALDPFQPDPSQIAIEDIAHHLSRISRFGGAISSEFYSVAQHSVLVARELPQWTRFALLHDAAEAYLGDIPSPLKQHHVFAAYRETEAHLEAVIYRRFGIVPEPDGVVALALVDRRMRRTEQRDLMPPPLPGENRDDVEPYQYRIYSSPPDASRAAFLRAWAEAIEVEWASGWRQTLID